MKQKILHIIAAFAINLNLNEKRRNKKNRLHNFNKKDIQASADKNIFAISTSINITLK